MYIFFCTGNDIPYHWYVIISQTVLLLISMIFVSVKCNSNFVTLIQLCILVLLVASFFIEIMAIFRSTFLFYQRISTDELRKSGYYSNGVGASTDEKSGTQLFGLYPVVIIISLCYFGRMIIFNSFRVSTQYLC